MNELGYNKPLYIMAFDHRASFAKKVLGWEKEDLSPEDLLAMQPYKQIIFDAIVGLVDSGKVQKDEVAVLVDEATGDPVLRAASSQGIKTILTVEKSGQEEFSFEYGDNFAAHIEKYNPTFAKVLIRYNPEDTDESNARQQKSLKVINDYCKAQNLKFLIEPLIPATEEELIEVGGDKKIYDTMLRPGLEVRMIAELQGAGIEPDVWKLEGLGTKENYEAVVAQARYGERKNVSVVILGREASVEQVDAWLETGAQVEGVNGFAIGRTIFEEALKELVQEKISQDEAKAKIAENFLHFYNTFKHAKA